jgi:hypothetical protein
MPSEVRVVGWREGFMKISFTHLLMERCGMGLAEAKHALDKVLYGGEITVTLHHEVDAERFCADATALGAVVERVTRQVSR